MLYENMCVLEFKSFCRQIVEKQGLDIKFPSKDGNDHTQLGLLAQKIVIQVIEQLVPIAKVKGFNIDRIWFVPNDINTPIVVNTDYEHTITKYEKALFKNTSHHILWNGCSMKSHGTILSRTDKPHIVKEIFRYKVLDIFNNTNTPIQRSDNIEDYIFNRKTPNDTYRFILNNDMKFISVPDSIEDISIDPYVQYVDNLIEPLKY